MTHNGEALSRLRGIRLEDLTAAQMSSVLGTTTLTPATVDALVQAAIVSQGMTAQRTYANGNLPVPEAGSIFFEEVGALGVVTLRPTGSQIWELTAVRGFGDGGTCTTATAYEDGTSSLIFRPSDSIAQAGTNYDFNSNISAPIQLTNSLYMTITETGGANGLRIQAAYMVVSL